MTVLFITRKFPPSVGGMQLFARDLSAALGQVIGLKLVKWGGSNRWLIVVLPYFFVKSCVLLMFNKIDIIHGHDGLLAPMIFVLARIFRKPYVIVIHGLDITHKNPIYQKFIVPYVAKANLVVTISKTSKDECLRRGIDSRKILIIPLAVNDEIYGRASRTDLLKQLKVDKDAKILLTVGRLVKRKGVAWFIDNVLPDLVAKNPQILYLVLGEGPDRPQIEQVIERHNLNNNVILLGQAPRKTLLAAYNGADIFVMPNVAVPGDMEGFGLVSLEASLCQLAVVASNIEGITDAITNNANGFLLTSGDAKEFYTKIDKLLGSQDEALKFGKASRKYTLEHHQWRKIAKLYVKEYLQLTNQNT